jgi:hypothetical protein
VTVVDHPHEPIDLPDPDAIRAAIDAADERARLLRRLLRIALRLRYPEPPTVPVRNLEKAVTDAAR